MNHSHDNPDPDDRWEEHDDTPLRDGETEEVICATCNGSGEGMYDGSRCANCGGSGVDWAVIEHNQGEDE